MHYQAGNKETGYIGYFRVHCWGTGGVRVRRVHTGYIRFLAFFYYYREIVRTLPYLPLPMCPKYPNVPYFRIISVRTPISISPMCPAMYPVLLNYVPWLGNLRGKNGLERFQYCLSALLCTLLFLNPCRIRSYERLVFTDMLDR